MGSLQRFRVVLGNTLVAWLVSLPRVFVVLRGCAGGSEVTVSGAAGRAVINLRVPPRHVSVMLCFKGSDARQNCEAVLACDLLAKRERLRADGPVGVAVLIHAS
jgi:Ca2+/Na+ antiporter